MKRFVEGSKRAQGTLLPDYLDDFVGEDNPIRVVDAFIDALDLIDFGLKVRCRQRPEGRLPSGGAFEDLPVRLSQPHPVEPPARC